MMKLKLLLSVIALSVLAFSTLPVVGQAKQVGEVLQSPKLTKPYAVDTLINNYMPLVRRGRQAPASIGSEMYGGQDATVMSRARGANIRWTRISGLNWKAIEPVRTNPPTYNWSSVDEASIKAMTANEIEVIAMVRWTPDWAQKYPGISCGPVAQDALDAFAQFMSAAVSRYSKAPYSIHYWEIGNEPDIDHLLVGPDNEFGCWGEESDPYYGGGYFATMLEKVYPAIKAADPSATVIPGGLLLDCDPTNPPEGKTCLPAYFLEGILRNNGKMNGGNYFDMVSFHGYPFYNGTLQMDEHFPSWEARGGVVLGKANFIREVLAKYNVSKPLFHSEGSLTCPEFESVCNPPGGDFYEAQADFVVWMYIRNIADGIKITTWFQFIDGWRYDGLLYSNLNPKLSYNALQFLTTEIGIANYTQQITTYTPLRTYEFVSTSKKIWVMWSPDEQTHPFNLPVRTLNVFDKYGADVTPVNNVITIKSPVYVEIAP